MQNISETSDCMLTWWVALSIHHTVWKIDQPGLTKYFDDSLIIQYDNMILATGFLPLCENGDQIDDSER